MSNFHNAYGSGLYPTVQETVPYEASIYDLYKKVLEAHEKLLALLRVDTTVSAIRLATGLVPEVEDICSRLRIWGEQTCAVLPPRARRSLDKQLCEDDLTKKIILRSLERLYNHIMRGRSAVDNSTYFLLSLIIAKQPDRAMLRRPVLMEKTRNTHRHLMRTIQGKNVCRQPGKPDSARFSARYSNISARCIEYLCC